MVLLSYSCQVRLAKGDYRNRKFVFKFFKTTKYDPDVTLSIQSCLAINQNFLEVPRSSAKCIIRVMQGSSGPGPTHVKIPKSVGT